MSYENGGFQENSQPKNDSIGNTSDKAKNWNNPYKGKGGGGYGGFKKKPPRDFINDPPVLYKPYFTYSNSKPPEDIMARFKEIGELLLKNGYTVRCSAFEDTSDSVFQTFDPRYLEVILPWQDFGKSTSKLTFTSEDVKYFAKQLFLSYETTKKPVQYFMSKDIRLVSGQNLKSIAQFGLIWTPDGCESLATKTRETGFAGNILLVAHKFRVPLFNVSKSDVRERLIKHLQLEHT